MEPVTLDMLFDAVSAASGPILLSLTCLLPMVAIYIAQALGRTPPPRNTKAPEPKEKTPDELKELAKKELDEWLKPQQ